MKNIIICLITFLFLTPSVVSQSLQNGMKYQAVARDLKGEVLGNQQIELRINLKNDSNSVGEYYSETHNVTTNQLGLFSLVIGDGNVVLGSFDKIPWSQENIWISIEIKDLDLGAYTIISNTKLLAVPYAFHATTATKLASTGTNITDGSNPNARDIGIPSQNWSLFGNRNSDPENDKLGTTDEADLVVITNNVERLRITADGEILTGDGKFTIGGNLEVQGESTTVNNDLYVGRNVRLNNNNTFDPPGETINYGNFTVENGSSTNLTGLLDVIDDGTFEDDLTVKDTLFVKTLVSKGLTIKEDIPDTGYLASFENTNAGNGDGILIKLGKARANDGLPDENVEEETASNVEAFRNLLGNTYSVAQKQDILEGLSIEILKADAEFVIETALGVGNLIIGFLNTELNLPVNFPGLSTPPFVVDVPVIPTFTLPGISIIPEFEFIPEIPEIPGFTIDLGGAIGVVDIEPFDLTDLDFWGVPNIQLTDLVLNPLDNDNEFITFADKNSIRMGAIKAQSVENWVFQYLSPAFMFRLRSAIKSTVDKKHAKWHFQDLVSRALISYKDIGVEYSSGNGDYAEWLERLDPNESISTGDIVAVKGGKITKDLTNAEQVMAVSHRPIVLGNIPKSGMNHLGNNIAFMGQIPVKIMGPVNTGDYIVGKGEINGYGVAISPQDMSLEDFKNVVGRSWDEDDSIGPKMVNTVVGVHNGDYIKILQKYEAKFKETSDRLQNVESKIDELAELISINKL